MKKMKCDLCLKEKENIKIIERNHRLGYICERCEKNFYDYPNRIIKDYLGKYWYISDERKFGENAKLTFGFSLKQAFYEFNPLERVFILKTGEKVAYYWIIERELLNLDLLGLLKDLKNLLNFIKQGKIYEKGNC